MAKQNDDFDKRMAEMEQRMAEMMNRSMGQMVDRVDEVVERRTSQLGNMVQNMRGAAMDFASNLAGMDATAPPAQPQQRSAPQSPARPQAPPPAAQQPQAEQQAPAAPREPAPEQQGQAAPPSPKKPLPSRKSVADGSKESQVFDRSNKPHLENPTLLSINYLSKRYDNCVLAEDQRNLYIHEGDIF